MATPTARDVPTCRACARLPRHGFDGFCSAECRRAWEHEHEIIVERDRETTEGDCPAALHCGAWRGSRRLNLQNSA